jgi:hypothetical protein
MLANVFVSRLLSIKFGFARKQYKTKSDISIGPVINEIRVVTSTIIVDIRYIEKKYTMAFFSDFVIMLSLNLIKYKPIAKVKFTMFDPIIAGSIIAVLPDITECMLINASGMHVEIDIRINPERDLFVIFFDKIK